MAKHQKSWNTNHVGRSQSVRAKHPQTHREGETATGWGVSETPVETSLLAWSFPTHLPHLRGLDTLSMTTAHHSVILPRSVWAAGGGPISLDVGGDDSARLPKNRHGYPLGGSQLLQTGRGGGVWTADEHPHRGWSGSGGRQETTGQRDRFAWKSHGGREVQRELPLIRLGQWATHLTVIQIAKEPHPLWKIVPYVQNRDAVSPKALECEECSSMDSRGPWWEWALPFQSFVNAFNVLIFTLIEQASVTLISQDC